MVVIWVDGDKMLSVDSSMLAKLSVIMIILGSALCCKDPRFILDYAASYSLSEIVIVNNMDEIEDPIRYCNVASPSDRADWTCLKANQFPVKILILPSNYFSSTRWIGTRGCVSEIYY